MKKKWILYGLSLMMLLSSCALMPQEENLPEAPILTPSHEIQMKTVTAERMDLVLEESFSCKYTPANSEALSFSVPGQRIAAVYVSKGDLVEPGDLLAELDNTAVLDEIYNQKRAVESLQIQISQNNDHVASQLSRVNILREGSADDPDLYQGQIDELNRDVESTREHIGYLQELLSIEQIRLNELNEKLRSRQIFSSMAGTVSYAVSLEDKDIYSSDGKIVCSVMDFSNTSFVGVFDRIYFEEGQIVNLVYDKQDHEAVVEKIIAEDTAEGQKVNAYFAPVIPDVSLKAGANATITVIQEQRNGVICLPEKTVNQHGGAPYVYYLDENGFKAVKEVKTGLKAQGMIEIISGLKEGEQVIE